MKNRSFRKRLKVSLLSFTSVFALLITTNTFLYSKAHNYKEQQTLIFETDRFENILSYVDAHTLVVVDIDNTLIHSKTMLGSAQWYYDLVNQSIQKGYTKEEGLEKHSYYKNQMRCVPIYDDLSQTRSY